MISSYEDVVGQDAAVSVLKGFLEFENMPRVILLYGPPGNGKTTLAKVTASYLVSKDESSRVELLTELMEYNNSTTKVELYNLSTLSDESIKEVSKSLKEPPRNGKKVLILDEAHGASKYHQDSILVELEHLCEDTYVFFCTTDISELRGALLSRCKLQLALNYLGNDDIHGLIKKTVEERQFKLSINVNIFCHLLTTYANRDLRRIMDTLLLFRRGSSISAEKIKLLLGEVNYDVGCYVCKYLYEDKAIGLIYIEKLDVNSNFKKSLKETVKLLYGVSSPLINLAAREELMVFMEGKDKDIFIKFVGDLLSRRATKESLTGLFLKYNVEAREGLKNFGDLKIINRVSNESVIQEKVNVKEKAVKTTLQEDTLNFIRAKI